MIGVFDSGLGGLTVLKEIIKVLPEYDYMYFGDTLHVPYGNRSDKAIYDLTKNACDYLFDHGCTLIIIACNTATAKALRKLQQEYLPSLTLDLPRAPTPTHVNILGVIRPVAEEIARLNKQRIGVIGTRGTVNSEAYVVELEGQRAKVKGQKKGQNIKQLTRVLKKEFELEKDGAVVRVSNLILQKDINGEYIKTPSIAQIRVSPSQALTAGANILSQPKTIAIEVFNLKPDAVDFISNEDCDFNNPARYPASETGAPQVSTITVNLRRSEGPLIRGPNIKLISLSPKTAKPGEKITLSAEVTDTYEMKLGKPIVTLEAIPASGTSKTFTPVRINNNQYSFEISPMELKTENRPAGVYTLKITATSQNPSVRVENLPETITIMCANDGECATTCPEDKVIDSPAISCPALQNCCKTS